MSSPSSLLRSSIIGVAALLLAVALGGCSALQLGYGQADAFVYRWLDGYADFDGAQGYRVRQAIASWFDWHRRTQLADYADLLERLDGELPADTTPERVCGWWGEAKLRVDRALERAVPAFAEVGQTLSAAQFAHIEAQQMKSNVEFRERALEPDPRRRSRDAAGRFADRAEWLYGEVTRAQRERLALAWQQSGFDPALAYEERRLRQEDGVRTLQRLAGLAPAAAQAEVRGWFARIERSPRESYRRQAEQQTAHACRMFAEVHNSATPAQRQAASRRVRGWIADLREMARAPGA
jgi:hypothetical protein